jgi:hypothetical protein
MGRFLSFYTDILSSFTSVREHIVLEVSDVQTDRKSAKNGLRQHSALAGGIFLLPSTMFAVSFFTKSLSPRHHSPAPCLMRASRSASQ